MNQLRRLIASLLPYPVKHILKKMYYPRVLRRFPDSGWAGAEIIKELVGPGDLVVDAGANIGYVAMLLARWVGSRGQVLSFEPIPETYDLLASNLKRLGLANVRTFPFALSSRDGRTEMEVPRYAAGGENFYESRVVDQPGAAGLRTFSIETRMLDSLLDPGRPVAFLKIDVEGHEWNVVQGAEQMLRRDRPALFVELSGDPDDAGSPAGQLFHFTASLGYRAYGLHAGTLRLHRVTEHSVDYFFLTDAHIARISCLTRE